MHQVNATGRATPSKFDAWLSAVAAVGFYSKSVETVLTPADLNNFALHWPGGMYRQQATEEPLAAFYERPNLEFQLHLAELQGEVERDVVQRLRLYSARYLQQSPRQFYEAVDTVLEKFGLTTQFDAIVTILRGRTCTDVPGSDRKLQDLLFAAYRELRGVG